MLERGIDVLGIICLEVAEIPTKERMLHKNSMTGISALLILSIVLLAPTEAYSNDKHVVSAQVSKPFASTPRLNHRASKSMAD